MSNPQKWWSKDTVALVTGGNKGIGFEIVKQLATQGLTVILTSRDENRGLEAKQALKNEGIDVDFHTLDVSSTESSQRLADWLRKQYNGLNILINNAAIGGRPVSYTLAQSCIQTNYFGVKHVIREMLPLLKASPAGARIVNVSSERGKLQYLGDLLKERFEDVNNLTEEKLDMLANEYLEAVKDDRWQAEGWPFTIYMASKALLNTYTRLVARSVASRPDGQKIYVNCMHPGKVKTDLNQTGRLSPAEGADTVWLALLPPGCPSGQFFYQRSEYEF